MAKEVAISKKLKISTAQQYILLSVLGTSLVLGVAIALLIHFYHLFNFNVKVISEQEKSIVSYSDLIKTIGVCEKPSGSIYSDSELSKCDPENIDISKIPNTLRSNILTNLAANQALNSVPKIADSSCINPETNKNYTYKELNDTYNRAASSNNKEELASATQMIRSCSALRVIPDALPSFKNEEALLASLNQILILSDWEPEALSPSGEITAAPIGNNLNAMSVRLSVEADSATTMRVLNNIERSIREFNIEKASIEWGGDQSLVLNAQATAYYMDKSSISQSNVTVTAEGQ